MEPLRLKTARGRWVLLATVLGSGMAQLDGTVVNVALPRIGDELEVGLSSLQWVITAYTLTLAAFLLLGGGLGDRYGRRKIFMIGVIWFAVASIFCAVSPNAPTLIMARALQGVGGALLTPGSLAILQTSFADEDRGRVIGAWSGLTGVASAIGPFVGGWLLDVSSWRWIFVLNIPLAVGVLLVCVRHVPESRDESAQGSPDWAGGVLAAAALAALTYGLIEGPANGWPVTPIVVLVVAVGLLAGFLLLESRRAQPMLPLKLFRARQFDAANAVTFAMYAALSAFLFLVPVELQTVSGYSALQAGTSLLPVTILMLLLSARSGALAARIGPRLQMSVGPLVLAGGMLLLTRVGPDANYLTEVLPAVFVIGLGLSTTVAPLTAAALSTVPGEHAGIASAVNNDVARTGGLLAVAVLPALAGISGDDYRIASAFDSGFSRAAVICAGLAAAGGILAALTIRNTPLGRGRTPDLPGDAPVHVLPSCAGLDAAPLAAER
ncbi:MAG: putative transrane efflux protein [Mycobacterium sp.]|nr:putative transrane efflux protein [Mycobacterium sp.]